MEFNIITCPQWGAAPPKIEPTWTSTRATSIIIHGTAGHHPEISLPNNESREEAIRYARDIQKFHMSPSPTDPSKPWIDSGHNFLVCRNGLVLQGRWRSVRAIERGKMVVSAHCPGQNRQIGIEHEHLGEEPMPDVQRLASADLIAWISTQYNLSSPLLLFPHSKFFPTECPANIKGDIPNLTWLAQRVLNQ